LVYYNYGPAGALLVGPEVGGNIEHKLAYNVNMSQTNDDSNISDTGSNISDLVDFIFEPSLYALGHGVRTVIFRNS